LDSPQLQLELERLMRDVEIQTQVFITLQQQYELARIEEVKETPSVIILDKGMPSVGIYKPKRFLIVFTAFILSLCFSLVFVTINNKDFHIFSGLSLTLCLLLMSISL
jgi:uncharacterized protein involved in exopolysaccharide biosynthesis